LAVSSFKKCVYRATDFNFSPTNRYTVQNVSPDKSVYILIKEVMKDLPDKIEKKFSVKITLA